MTPRKPGKPTAKGSNQKTGARPGGSPPRAVAAARPEVPAGQSPVRGETFCCVGIGASAGGLAALQAFFGSLPRTTGLAFFVVQHLDPTRPSETPALLQHHSDLKVKPAENGEVIAPDHVYVLPPDRYMRVNGTRIVLSPPSEPRGLRLPVDIFFYSLAESLGERAIGVVLSGSGTDGSLGLRALKGAGGMTVVQDPGSAEFDGMPRSAIATGMADLVLPVEQMGNAILSYASHPYATRPADATGPEARSTLLDVVTLLQARGKMDFSSYKKAMLLRRIERRMGLKQIRKAKEYLDLLREDGTELEALANDLLIQVSHFFREPFAWNLLARDVIPAIIQQATQADPVRVWVAGCATGEEAYSIAMLLLEAREAAQGSFGIQVFASDVDSPALDFARSGSYPETVAADLSPERLRRFFVHREHHYVVAQQLRDAVIFAHHNLLTDPPFSRIDLVCCRNLLIYLEPAMQARVLALFHFSLKPDRFLFLGNSESVGQQGDLYKPLFKRARIYSRLAGNRRVALRTFRGTGMVSPGMPPLPALVPPEDQLLTRVRGLMLERFVPASILVDQHFSILYMFGPTQEFVRQPTGALTPNLLGWFQDGTRAKLRVTLQSALRKGEPATARRLLVKRRETEVLVSCHVEPVKGVEPDSTLLLLVFREEAPADLTRSTRSETDEPLVRQLEAELSLTQHELHTNMEQLESVNEDLRSLNEEAVSMNEELQSTNEELETSKEELQSLNEELTTVNSELENRIAELQGLNDDMTNLETSTDVPTVILDRNGRIRRYTPSLSRVLRVADADLGRPISDITQLAPDPSLVEDTRRVLTTLVTAESQITNPEGGIFLRRVHPYRTADSRIDGLVVTYFDITEEARASERAREARDYEAAIVETIREPLIVLDDALIVQSANAAFYRIFHLTPARTLGVQFFQLSNGEWDIPELRHLLEELLPRESQLTDYEVRRNFEGAGLLFMCLNARMLAVGQRKLILLAMEDITSRINAEEARNQVLRQMVTSEEKERHRLALELHDETGQHVTAFLLGLAALRDTYANQPASRALIAEMQSRAEELARQLHGISLQLRPMALDDHGLERALTNYVEDMSLRYHVEVDLHASGSGRGRLPPHVETVLYRMTQEALTNVLKHANATRVSVLLNHKPREVSLVIEDDGGGFDAEKAMDVNQSPGSRLGLRGMRERIMLVRGTLTVESQPGKGATLFARIPLETEDE